MYFEIVEICLFLDGVSQSTLRDIKLKVLNQIECSKYVDEKLEQKYCTGEMNSGRDTCQVIFL